MLEKQDITLLKSLMAEQKKDTTDIIAEQKKDITGLMAEQKQDIIRLMEEQKKDIKGLMAEQKKDITGLMEKQKKDIIYEMAEFMEDNILPRLAQLEKMVAELPTKHYLHTVLDEKIADLYTEFYKKNAGDELERKFDLLVNFLDEHQLIPEKSLKLLLKPKR